MDIPIKYDNIEIKIKKINFTCSLCGKKFRDEANYNNHVRKQLCVKKENKTYCDICDLVFPTRKAYLKHLISPMHYKNLKKMEIEEFEAPIDDKAKVDPYLNKNDLKKLNQNYGDGISICFKNNDLLDIQFNNESGENSEENKEVIKENESIKEEENYLEKPEKKIVTERQGKILTFLQKIENLPDNEKKFLHSLSKLKLEDYNGLITAIISDESISIKGKQKYIQVLKLFKQLLEKKINEGTNYYNSILITDIINFLKF